MKYLLDNPQILFGVLVSAIFGLGLFFALAYGSEVKLAGMLIMMTAVGASSRIPQRFSGGDVGIELCLFFMVCTILGVGLWHGLVVGIFGMLLSARFTAERPDDVVVAIFGLGVIGVLVSFFGSVFSVLVLGVVCAVIYDLLVCTVYLVTGHTPLGCLRFSATHVLWNFVVFRALGVWLLGVLASL